MGKLWGPAQGNTRMVVLMILALQRPVADYFVSFNSGKWMAFKNALKVN